MKKMLIGCWGLFMWSLIGMSIYGQSLEIVTENYPPYNYEENGHVTGFSTEVVEAVVQKAGIQGTPRVYPWARAYKMALHNENTLIYTITRNAEREDLFKWVGPLASRTIFLFKLKEREEIQIRSLNDAKSFKIGVVIDDAFSMGLIEEGFVVGTHLEQVPREEQNIKKLFNGRIDLVGNVELYMAYTVKSLGLDFDKLEKVYEIQDNTAYFMALSKNTPDSIVERLQDAFDELLQDGTYDKIAEKYLK